jgi:cobalt-zinc-cadmium efflux system outer membrane protein
LAALATLSCAPSHAGYPAVQRLGAERLGVKPVWHQAESAQARERLSAQVKEWLAAPLTPELAVRIAIFNSPSLQASFEDLGNARAALVQALRIPNPVASAALRFDGSTRPEIDLSVTEDLTDLVFIAAREGIAQVQLDAAALGVVSSALALGYEVRAAFYRYQAALQQAELRRTALSALQASFEVAERLHAAGNITELSLATEQGAYEEARLATTRAESELLADRERLGALMGVFNADVAWRVSPRLPELPANDDALSDLERRSLANSLDLRAIKVRFAAAARRANLARWRGALPELRAGVSAERQAEWAVGPLVELELPLFYQNQGEAQAAVSEMRRQKSLFDALALRVRAGARATATRLSAIRRNAAHYRDTVLPLRARILEASQLEYNAMNIGVFQLLEAKRAQVQAGSASVETLRDYWLSRADAEQLLAGRLPSSAFGMEAPVGEGSTVQPRPAGATH